MVKNLEISEYSRYEGLNTLKSVSGKWFGLANLFDISIVRDIGVRDTKVQLYLLCN